MSGRFVTAVSLGLLVLLGSIAPAAELAVGVATTVITPPAGYRMAGYFHERANTGTKDPLMAKVIVLRQGDRRAVLVFCDLIGISRDLAREARTLAQEKTGIPAANIAVCATHSHTGPLYFGVLRRHFHDKAVAAHGSDPREEVDYPAVVARKLADAVAKAQASLAPARLDAGVARQEGLAFNRRFHMKNGKVVTNPGQRNPDIVRVAGPIDPEVGLIAIYPDGEARPAAALSVFALHLDTVGGTEYSADYPHHLEVALRETFGPRFVSCFGAGTCGDINHIDVTIEGRRPAKEIGEALARTIAARIPGLSPIASPSLDVAHTVVTVPVQHYTDAELAESRANLERIGDPKIKSLDMVRSVTVVDLRENYGEGSVGLEVQVFRLGPDTAIVTLPGEVFVEHGLAIKKASPFRTTLVIELANNAAAYIPTKKGFEEGSYEVVNSRVAPGGGERMVDAAIKLLKDLAR